jgi:hypothetical protein
MAANLAEIGLITVGRFISLPVLTNIGGIQVDTTIEEAYEDRLEITEHPVEAGAQITDHSFKRPMEVRLRCGWSDSSLYATLGAVVNFATGLTTGGGGGGSFTGGGMSASDYVAGIYSQLLQLQEGRQPFTVFTGLRIYTDMLLTSIRVRRDNTTRYALMVEAELRQVIIVDTQTATLPPQANQANPASTAETVNAGTQSLQPGSPGNGGSLPADQWTGPNLISR